MPIHVNLPLEIVFNEKIPNTLYYQNEDSIINPSNARPIQQNQISSEVWSIQFSPDGSILVWQSGQSTIKLMKWKDYNEKKTQNIVADDESTRFSKNFVNKSHFSQRSGWKHKFTNKSNETIYNENSLNDEIYEICCGDTIWSLAFGSTKSYVKHKRLIHKPKTSAKVNNRFQLSQEDNYLILAVGLVTGKIKIYQVESNCELKLLFNVYDHKGIVNDLKFTIDGSLLLASASRDETIKLWNMFDDGNLFKTLRGNGGRFYACDWSPTASLLCAVGSNRTAIIWNTETYNVI